MYVGTKSQKICVFLSNQKVLKKKYYRLYIVVGSSKFMMVFVGTKSQKICVFLSNENFLKNNIIGCA